ncbi:hypothetical protein PBY51_020554 [Eleginops maclovinus]|uniref:General transcription factor II-I repeat domain-containing protein 2 n=1 Tax=Eleginops maclovinus TaxID=56733 RepID=A0AAN7XTX5_ELEMC|nr:hypothetical protein PBY51_020554 [Eleginops maclovinus]
MESLKGKTRGEDLYEQVSAVIERMKLPWSKLANVTTDGSPNLTGKNVGLLSDPPSPPVVRTLGKVLQRVWELKEEIRSFLELMGKFDEFPELSDTNWLCDFAFAVDIFSHMNELNVKLQGKDQFVHDMHTNVRAFKSKLVLFSRQMSNKSFTHFPTLAVQKEAARNAKKYCKSLDDLHREFCRRFCDFEKIDKSLQLVSCPLSQDPEAAPQELQLELIDLQSDSVLKEKF